MAHDVFISYSSHDKATADAVCAFIEARGIRCWIAPRDVLPGASWAESIIDAIEASMAMVLIFSAKANTSAQIQREVERAVNKGVTVIPLRIEDTLPNKTMEYFISTPHWLDALKPPLEQHIERLADSIKTLLSRPDTRQDAAASGKFQFVPGIGGTAAGPAPASAPAGPAKSLPPKAAPVAAPAAAPAAAPVVPSPTRPRATWPWVVVAAIAGVLVTFGAVRLWQGRAPARSAPEATTAAAPTAPQGGTGTTSTAPAERREPAPIPEPAPPAAPGTPASASVTPSGAAATSAAVPGTPPAATGKAAAAPTTGAARKARTPPPAPPPAPAVETARLVVDFQNPFKSGTVVLSVDDKEVWTSELGKGLKKGLFGTLKVKTPTEQLQTSLDVTAGPRVLTVALYDADKKPLDTESLRVEFKPVTTRVLQVRVTGRDKKVELTVP